MDIFATLTKEFNIRREQVENTVALIDDGNTIPFIARYRKEVTGSLDDMVLRNLNERLTYLRKLEEQREKILASIESQGKLTEELAAQIENASTVTELDDLYRPYRPKRKTRASVAKAKGLEPLALTLYAQEKDTPIPEEEAEKYINEELGVATKEEALAGASDIIAELISDDAELRRRLRYVCRANARLVTKQAGDDAGVYAMYADYSEPLAKIAGHRVLAVNRGEKEGFIKVSIDFERAKAMAILYNLHVKDGSPATDFVASAAEDAYDRLIFPSIENEIRNEITDSASDASIKVFSLNLRQLLMQPPVKGKVAIGLDPGIRTGCKVAVVDETGKVLDHGVIFPLPEQGKVDAAKATVRRFISKYKAEVFAIGNGTASHETEVFVSDLIREMGPSCGLSYMVVSEAGASVYSASELAAKEFPEYDVTIRGAISIARRLQDPLSELVKIDPKSIGVGQYQHDMPEAHLNEALGGVVEDCVNTVGVDLNTASAPLLSRVSGIGTALAANIVAYREENGAFTSRTQLKKVSKLGPKAFLQCAGFLRIPESKNILDNTAVHPESYDAAERLLSICGLSLKDIKANSAALEEKVLDIGEEKLAKELEIGVPTLQDIVKELLRPGRDPRDELPKPLLRSDVISIESLTPGMELTGTVRNLVDFGAFVDIGVHRDGLVHVTKISNRFVKHPTEVLSVGDIVTVWVEEVDLKKQRISLTMKKPKSAQ